MNNVRSTNNFVMGIIAGSITGAAIALLYAPTSGRKLRRNISRTKDELIRDADRYLRKARKEAVHMIEDGKKKAENIIKDTKKKVDGIAETASKMIK